MTIARLHIGAANSVVVTVRFVKSWVIVPRALLERQSRLGSIQVLEFDFSSTQQHQPRAPAGRG